MLAVVLALCICYRCHSIHAHQQSAVQMEPTFPRHVHAKLNVQELETDAIDGAQWLIILFSSHHHNAPSFRKIQFSGTVINFIGLIHFFKPFGQQ